MLTATVGFGAIVLYSLHTKNVNKVKSDLLTTFEAEKRKSEARIAALEGKVSAPTSNVEEGKKSEARLRELEGKVSELTRKVEEGKKNSERLYERA